MSVCATDKGVRGVDDPFFGVLATEPPLLLVGDVDVVLDIPPWLWTRCFAGSDFERAVAGGSLALATAILLATLTS